MSTRCLEDVWTQADMRKTMVARMPDGYSRSSRRLSILLCVLFCALTGGLAAIGILYDYSRTQALALQRLEHTTDLIAEWIIGAFHASDYLLRDLAGLVESETLEYPASDPQAQRGLTERLIAKKDTLPYAFLVGVFNRDCIVTHTNVILGFDASDRPYCRALREYPGRETVVTPAYVNNLNRLNVTQARRLASETGDFRGLVAIGVDLAFFSAWLDRIEVGRAGSVTIVDTAGLLLARKPVLPEALGRQVVEPRFLEALARGDAFQVIVGPSPIDGVVRLFGIRRVADLPFVVVVGEARRELLADWFRRALVFSGIIVLLWLLSVLFLRKHLLLVHLKQERLEQQRRFMSMLTHEIRTPLAVLRLALDEATPSERLQVRAREAVTDIEGIIERCALSNRLDDGALELQVTTCDLAAFLQAAIEARPEAARFRSSRSVPPEARKLRVDAVLLRQGDRAIWFPYCVRRAVAPAGS